MSIDKVVVNDIDDNDNELSLESFFVLKDYQLISYEFNINDKISLYSSTMSSTDYDLTGQIIWPASILLSLYLLSNKSNYKTSTILELGAGCGLSSFSIQKYVPLIYITDGNNIVYELIEKNITYYKELGYHHIHGLILQWGLLHEVR